MSECERCQLDVSGLWDEGRTEASEARRSLLHLAECPACREFVRRMGLIEKMGPERSGAGDPRPEMPRRGILRALAAAAMLAALLGGAWLAAGSNVLPPPPDQLEIRLAASGSSMTEARFLEITRELLEADHRYRRVMLQVLGEIETQVSQATGTETSGEEAIRRSEDEKGLRRPRV